MSLKLSNDARSLLAGTITSSSTTLSVGGTDASRFPALEEGDWHPLTIVDAAGNREIVHVTARTDAVMTVLRGREGTTARAFEAGASVSLRMTGEALLALNDDCLLASAVDIDPLLIANSDERVASQKAMKTYVPAQIAAYARERLKSDRTYYVRADGSDNNTGGANNSGAAFRTVQKALDVAKTLDLNGFDIFILVANGTYAGFEVEGPFVGDGYVIVRGNTGSPQSVVFNTTINLGDRAVLSIEGARFTTTDGDGIRAIERSHLYLSTVQFGAIDDTGLFIERSDATFYGPYAIVGDCGAHIVIVQGSLYCLYQTVTLTGTPDVGCFISVYTGGGALMEGNTYNGGAEGWRYEVATNGIIETNGAGENYLPGSISGEDYSGGVYV